MRVNLDKMINFFIIFIFITFPFWEVITAQFVYVFNISYVLMGVFKYIVLLTLISLLLLRLLNNRLVLCSSSVFLLIYVFYVGFHFIGSSHMMLKFEGFRYEYLFPLLALLLFNQDFLKIVNIDVLIKIIFFQGFVIITIAIYEYLNQEILTSLYRKSLEDIPHITWFSINRLISVVGNPINLGASLIIWVASYIFYIKNYNNSIAKTLFPVFLFIVLFIVLMTLSRSSLLVFLLVVMTFLLFGIDSVRAKILIIGFVGLLTIIFVGYLVQNVSVDLLLQRFGNLTDRNEYTGNVRIQNWYYALSALEPIEYIWGKGLGASTPNSYYVELYGGLMIENSFISIMVNYGLIGLLMFLLIVARFFYISFIFFKRNNPLGLFFLLFLIVYIFFSMANDFNRNLPYALYFWVFYFFAEMNFRFLIKGLKPCSGSH